MRRVFVRFLEEIEDSKKAFRNYLTFTKTLIKIKRSGETHDASKDVQVRDD